MRQVHLKKALRTTWQLCAIGALSVGCAESTQQPAEVPTTPNAAETATPAAPAKNIVGETVTYKSGDTTLVGYLAYDAASTARRPGVLIVHEWWGPNEYVRMRARQLADLGYVAFAVDMYGEGKTVDEPAGAKELSSSVYADLDTAEQRFNAGIEQLKASSFVQPENISAIGYCFGGGIILNMARRGADLDGVASFHGSLGTATPAPAGTFKGKVLVLTGGADPMVPEEEVEAFRQEMANAGVPTEIHSYPGALHAFTNPGATELGKKFELPIAYDAEADIQSFKELTEFLTELYPPKAQ